MGRYLLSLTAGMMLACHDSPADLPPPDTSPPKIEVTGTAQDGDSNGDGFVDFMVNWSGSPDVDPALTTIRDISDGGSADINLFRHWNAAISGSTLSVSERVPHILSGGHAMLEIGVRDSAGNAALDTIAFELPHAKIIKTISTGRDANFVLHAVDIAICGDGLGYMPAGLNMVIFDPDSLTLVADVPNRFAFDAMFDIVCDRNDETIYVTDPFMPFNTRTRTWSIWIADTYGANALLASPTRPELIYVGEGDGAVVTFDRTTRRRLGRITPASSRRDDPIFALAVLPDDSKLYATRAIEGGVLVIDPKSKTILKRIDIGMGWAWPGRSDDIDLDPTARHLYVAILDGARRGVAIVSTVTDEITGFIELHSAVPQSLAVSPSGRRLFVTTQDQWEGVQSKNALIDLQTKQVLEFFDRPRVGGRWDAEVVFHEHGKYFFVARNMDIDVYLNRE